METGCEGEVGGGSRRVELSRGRRGFSGEIRGSLFCGGGGFVVVFTC